jgi:hypothetical protein
MSYSTKGKKRFANCTLSGPVYVYVRDGKIIRIQPLFYSEDGVIYKRPDGIVIIDPVEMPVQKQLVEACRST